MRDMVSLLTVKEAENRRLIRAMERLQSTPVRTVPPNSTSLRLFRLFSIGILAARYHFGRRKYDLSR